MSDRVRSRVSVAGLRFGPGSLSKLTVGLVASDQFSGFAKFPLTKGAVESLKNEVEAIGALSRFSQMSGHLPDVISSVELGETQGVLLSGGPTQRVRRPGSMLAGFLSEIHQLTARQSTIEGSGLLDDWLDSLDKRRDLLGPERSSTLDSAILFLRDRLGSTEIDIAVAHGDFTRWNIRRSQHGLYVFDWEASVDNALPYHDLFHYFAAESALLHRPSPTSYLRERQIRGLAHMVSPNWISLLSPLYCAYLVRTALWYAENRDWEREGESGGYWRFLWAQLARARYTRGFHEE